MTIPIPAVIALCVFSAACGAIFVWVLAACVAGAETDRRFQDSIQRHDKEGA